MVEKSSLSPLQPCQPLEGMVQDFVAGYSRLWWSLSGDFPAYEVRYAPQQQSENERRLARWIDQLGYALQHIPQEEEERQAWQDDLQRGLAAFGQAVFPYEQRHLDFIEKSGMIDAILAYISMARAFDPSISGEDIYQAGRNVMTCNFIQLLLGLPVEVTPAIFAYSMLYPYTDNYLDDPNVSREQKVSFSERFLARLRGDTVHLINAAEETIARLVTMIETQWDRNTHPIVYESLQSIHAAQTRSLQLILPGAAPYEVDVLGISFEKGGTSVLADGYLVAGQVPDLQAQYLFGYGAFTQLMDDLEDIPGDTAAHRLTIFTQAATGWPLDRLTSRLVHFGRAILSDLDAFHSPSTPTLSEIMKRSIDPILLDIAGRAGRCYTRDYLAAAERHFPYRYSRLRRLRNRLTRRKINFDTLAAALLRAPGAVKA